MDFIQKNCYISSRPVPFSSDYIFTKPESGVDCHLYTRTSTCFHNHLDYYEFSLVTNGQYWYYNASTRTKTLIAPNHITFIKVGESHQFFKADKDTTSQINISMTKDTFEKLLNKINFNFTADQIPPVSVLDISTTDYLVNLTNKIMLAGKREYSNFLIEQWVTTVIADVSSNLRMDPDMPQWFANCLTYFRKTEYIDKKLNELMSDIRCSPTTLNKYFRKYFNMSPNEYFLKQKLLYAKKLLRQSDMGILEISLDIGFDSLSHFNHFFKKQTGFTPTEYRKNDRSDGPRAEAERKNGVTKAGKRR